MGEIRNPYKIFVEKSEGKRQQDNIRTDMKK